MTRSSSSEYPPLVGITGPAGSGKDTAARVLYETFGYCSYSFADPLKRGLRAMFGLTPKELEVREFKESVSISFPESGKSPREMMQTLGTEWGREKVHPDVWLLLAARAYETVRETGRCMVIPDVRFDNEATWIRENGGVIFHMKRPDVAPVAAHKSEAGVVRDLADAVIINDGSLYDLRHHVAECMHFCAEVMAKQRG